MKFRNMCKFSVYSIITANPLNNSIQMMPLSVNITSEFKLIDG